MIKTEFGNFDGNGWEQLCKVCFLKMFNQDEIYFHIEATPGDDGIEGFTNKGKVFQCYCPDKMYEPDELYRKQQTKINADLKKLRDKRNAITKHLGKTIVKTWYLVTPEIRKKEIVAYCHKKTEEVKSWNLPFVDNDNFIVTAVDIDYIRPHISSVLGFSSDKIIYQPKVPSSQVDVEEYTENESYLVENALRKHSVHLRQGGADVKAASMLTHETISDYLDGIEILSLWRNQLPRDYERFILLLKQEEKEIALSSLYPNSNYFERYSQVKIRTEQIIKENFSHLDPITIKDLVNYAVADWLLRCSLNFVKNV